MRMGFELETCCQNERRVRQTLPAELFEFHHDGSISGNGSPLEIVSKPFQFEDLQTMINALDYVKDDLRVNNSTGLHFHVEIPVEIDSNLMMRTLINLLKITYNNQSVLFSLLPTHRRENTYCRAWRADEIQNIINQRTPLKTFQFIYGFNSAYRPRLVSACNILKNGRKPLNGWRKNSGRYKTLNLMPILDIGTVEFRMFNATLDWDEFKFYAVLVHSIVETAVKTVKVRTMRRNKIRGNWRNDSKRVYEFLRMLNKTDLYPYAKDRLKNLNTFRSETREETQPRRRERQRPINNGTSTAPQPEPRQSANILEDLRILQRENTLGRLNIEDYNRRLAELNTELRTRRLLNSLDTIQTSYI